MTAAQTNILIDKFHNTRLMRAARDGDVIGILNFLSCGDDIDQRSKFGKTALMIAADNGRLEAVRILVKKGAAINLQGGPSNQTALMYAIDGGYLYLVEEFIRLKANLDLRADSGDTALQMAILRRRSDMAFVLIDGGACLTNENIYGEAITQTAEKRQLHAVANRILDKIAEGEANARMLKEDAESRHAVRVESTKKALRRIDEEMDAALKQIGTDQAAGK